MKEAVRTKCQESYVDDYRITPLPGVMEYPNTEVPRPAPDEIRLYMSERERPNRWTTLCTPLILSCVQPHSRLQSI